MFLRSVNPQITMVAAVNISLVASVVYPGPVVEAAFIGGRAEFVVLLGGAAINIRAGLVVRRVDAQPRDTQSSVGAQITGERFTYSLFGLYDLVPGDVIGLVLSTFNANRLALVADGFSVAIR